MNKVALFLLGLVILAPLSVSAYNYPGYRWVDSSISYSMNQGLYDSSGIRTAIRTAAASWNGAGAKFSLYEEPPSTRYPSLLDPGGIYWDYHHDIAADTFKGKFNGAFDNYTAFVLTYYVTGDGINVIIDNDNMFNTDYFHCVGAVTNCYDIQSEQAHEFGHFLHLGHPDAVVSGVCLLGGANATMCTVPPTTIHARSLSTDDVNGIKAIYGSN